MPLTSPTLPVLLGFLAVAVFAVLAAGYPHLHRRWAAIGVRAGGLILLNMVVVAMVGVVANDHFDFYVSWADLAGARSAVTVTHRGATARSAASVRLTSVLHAGTTFARLPAPGRRIQDFRVTGPQSGVTGQITVLLPVGYSTATARRYPVIEALHGFPGASHSWLSGLNLQQSLDQAVASKVLRPAVVVLPQINVPYGIDSECVNGPTGSPQMETWLAQDVPQFLASHFAVDTVRSSWAVAGFSEGGWCSSMLGLRHPEVFSGAIVFSGAFAPEFANGYRPFGPHVPQRYDMIRLARLTPPPLAMWVQASKKDGYAYPPTAHFLKVVRAPLSVTTDLLKTGGHREQLWSTELPTALRWLGRSLPGFAP